MVCRKKSTDDLREVSIPEDRQEKVHHWGLRGDPSLTTLNPLSANPIKRLNTLKQFVGKLPANCLSVFVHFVNLVLKGLREPDLLLRNPKKTLSLWNLKIIPVMRTLRGASEPSTIFASGWWGYNFKWKFWS